MNTNAKTHLIEIPIEGNGGDVWNRLHAEREDICEAMIKDCQVRSGVREFVVISTNDCACSLVDANQPEYGLTAR